MTLRLVAPWFVGFVLALLPSAWGQPPNSAAEEAPSEAKPTADDEPNGASFDALLAKWTKNLKQLGALRDKYVATAAGEDKVKVRKEFDAKLAEGDALLPRLTAVALKRIEGGSGPTGEASEFLGEVVRDRIRRDDYEVAYDVSKQLSDAKLKVEGLPELQGVAAFMTNRFDEAAKLFDQADRDGQLSPSGARYQGQVPYYQRIWKDEKSIREAETKADDLPQVRLTTSKGPIVVELFDHEAPKAVDNFIGLVDKNFYDGLTFHRVLPNFMAQGGCPTGDGTGGPGYKIPCECHQPDARRHFRGTLSMAHAGRDTGGSQFFLTFVPTQQLDGKHTVFGRVVEGIDVLARLQRRSPNAQNAPTPDKILKAEVIRRREKKKD